MTILITGGTGKTGSRIARLLQHANEPTLLTSRSGTVPAPFKGVRFDWLDSTTYENPFNVDNQIDRVYLVGPDVIDVLSPMKAFIDLAILKGVKRFVLLSGSALEEGAPLMGVVHEYLVKIGVDYCVLRPSWFFENFTGDFLPSIQKEGLITSLTQDGRIPFVSADDIAETAFNALVDEPSHNTEYLLLGPELLSYNEACALISDIVGRKITHKRLSREEAEAKYTSSGISKEYADIWIGFETLVATGSEEKYFYNADKKVTGRRRLRGYLEANREVFTALE